jgi:hypothetical protein
VGIDCALIAGMASARASEIMKSALSRHGRGDIIRVDARIHAIVPITATTSTAIDTKRKGGDNPFRRKTTEIEGQDKPNIRIVDLDVEDTEGVVPRLLSLLEAFLVLL